MGSLLSRSAAAPIGSGRFRLTLIWPTPSPRPRAPLTSTLTTLAMASAITARRTAASGSEPTATRRQRATWSSPRAHQTRRSGPSVSLLLPRGATRTRIKIKLTVRLHQGLDEANTHDMAALCRLARLNDPERSVAHGPGGPGRVAREDLDAPELRRLCCGSSTVHAKSAFQRPICPILAPVSRELSV
jgi:hypothetical protein